MAIKCKTEHTQGPWFWEPVDRYPVTQLQPDVLDIYESHGGGSAPSSADAALIAAAPDLFEACEAAVEEWHVDNRNFERKEPKSLELARVAIAKAKECSP